MKDKLPLLEDANNINEEKISVPGKGEFVVSITAENNYIYFHLIPDSKMLDSIEAVGADKFKQDAIKFLSNKMGGVEFMEETGYHAGYKFKFHVTDLVKDLKNIIK